MTKFKWLLRIIGAIQIILGVMYLLAPGFLLQSMGHSVPNPDVYYPLGMLASRFIAYGIAFIYISSDPLKHKLWVTIMILIQAIDLGAGVFYTAMGIVPISLSGFPIFNAIWMMALLYFWQPKQTA